MKPYQTPSSLSPKVRPTNSERLEFLNPAFPILKIWGVWASTVEEREEKEEPPKGVEVGVEKREAEEAKEVGVEGEEREEGRVEVGREAATAVLPNTRTMEVVAVNERSIFGEVVALTVEKTEKKGFRGKIILPH